MADFILIDGDTVKFNSAFMLASVVVQDGTLEGKGGATLGGSPVCVEGDETNVEVQNCDYVVGAFTTPGKGTITIDSLGTDQVATKTNSAGKPVLLKGSLLIAKFAVTQPATNANTGASDPNTEYLGNGTFETSNDKWKGV